MENNQSEYKGFDFDAINAEIATLDDDTEEGSARMFGLAAAGRKALARDLYPNAASIALEDMNDDDGSPFFVVVTIEDAAGGKMRTRDEQKELSESLSE